MDIIEFNENKSFSYEDWNEQLSKSIKRFWRKIFKYSTIFLLLFFLLFKSPFFWFIGNNLVVYQEPKKTEAIVIFSGSGESGYTNISYQRRVLDALKFYEDGFSNKIILTSGRIQNLSEGEIIKSLLISRGLDPKSLILINRYPSSTFENVRIVKEYLDENNIKNIMLLTSPFHTKRSYLTWKKNAPDISVNFPIINEYSKKEVKWSYKYKEIKVIIYEIMAIIHNRFNNRL